MSGISKFKTDRFKNENQKHYSFKPEDLTCITCGNTYEKSCFGKVALRKIIKNKVNPGLPSNNIICNNCKFGGRKGQQDLSLPGCSVFKISKSDRKFNKDEISKVDKTEGNMSINDSQEYSRRSSKSEPSDYDNISTTSTTDTATSSRQCGSIQTSLLFILN
jgi:hypothetical protein